MNETGRKDPHRYDDIIDQRRPVSRNHKAMSLKDRAAQFAPFAALTGYDETIQEAGASFQLDEGVTYEPEE